MLLGFSALFIRPGQVGGAETMVHNLLQGLSSIERSGDKVRVFTNQPMGLSSGDGIDISILPSGIFPNRFLQETFHLPFVAHECDTFLFPNYFTPPITPGERTATVIHDLLYLHFPENFSRRKRLWLRASHELTLHSADVVVAISEFTKRELLDTYGYKFDDKIHVIHNPVSWDRYDSTNADLRTQGDNPFVESPYILSVAAHWPHKNLETLIRGYALLRKQRPELHLVLVGQRSNNLVGISRRNHLDDLITELDLDNDVHMTGFIPDKVLGQWYRHASLFVFPSLFEGFGMPPIEALGMGLPVLTTNCGALAEVTQGLATMLHNPTDTDEMCSMMLEMLRSPDLYRPSPADQARVRRQFAPSAVAQAYYDLLAASQ